MQEERCLSSSFEQLEAAKVKVPVANLIGKDLWTLECALVGVEHLPQENEGFGVIMKNFNHERWGFVVQEQRAEMGRGESRAAK